LKLVLIADTHGHHRNLKLPKGDVLIHAGDVSYRGEALEVKDFLAWFAKQNFEFKIFISGNHDFYFEKQKPKDIEAIIPEGIIYLNDSGTTIDGINVWGSPYTPKFYNWAFNKTRGPALKKHWDLIPTDTDILITHGPPYGILDQVSSESHVGCKDLLQKVQSLQLKLHVFGHIHESYGSTTRMATKFVNASLMNESYEFVNKPLLAQLQTHSSTQLPSI
jgi:Icc-related predicted phosphoesterase